jgi:hypothetical protein
VFKRALAYGLILVAALTCTDSLAKPWNGDAAIALAMSWGSPVGFSCVITWDVRYEAEDIPTDVVIEVRFPSRVQDLLVTVTPAGVPMTSSWPRFDEWQRPLTVETGQGSLAAMAARKHLVGAAGVPCAAMDVTSAMRGSEIRIRWIASAGPREQVIVVGEIRSWVRSSVNQRGELRLEWRQSG